jgi:hypothetical protein
MLSHEELFLLTVEDLRNKISIGNEYNLIRAYGLCRHLVSDTPPLMILASKPYNYKIKFHVADYSDMPIYEIGYKLDFFNIVWSTINPDFTAPKTKYVSKDIFLKVPLLKFNEHHYNVLDIIHAASHFMGGVHARDPKNNKEAALVALEKAAKTDEKLTFNAIRSVCKVVLKAMEPLEQVIKGNNLTFT